MWMTKCDCGRCCTKRSSTLNRWSGSCVCGGAPGKRHPLYSIWGNMKERCLTKTNHSYAEYGGRGIKICDRWLGPCGFRNFVADVGERPDGTSLDRINVNGNYEPSNVRWATAKEQSNNKRLSRTRVGELLDILERVIAGNIVTSDVLLQVIRKELIGQ